MRTRCIFFRAFVIFPDNVNGFHHTVVVFCFIYFPYQVDEMAFSLLHRGETCILEAKAVSAKRPGTALRQICRAQQNDTQDLVGLAVAACEGLSPLTQFACHPHCHLFAHKSWPSLLYRRSAQEKPRYTTMGPHYFFLATSPFESTGKSHGLQLSQHNLLL